MWDQEREGVGLEQVREGAAYLGQGHSEWLQRECGLLFSVTAKPFQESPEPDKQTFPCGQSRDSVPLVFFSFHLLFLTSLEQQRAKSRVYLEEWDLRSLSQGCLFHCRRNEQRWVDHSACVCAHLGIWLTGMSLGRLPWRAGLGYAPLRVQRGLLYYCLSKLKKYAYKWRDLCGELWIKL